MTINLILDLAIISLLLLTIRFALRLNKQLKVFQDNKQDFGDMIEGFQSATLRAEKSIHLLNQNAKDAGESLHEHLDKAQSFRDEIMFLLDRGSSVASRLEEDIQAGRDKHYAQKKKTASETAPQEEQKKQKNDEQFNSEVERQFYQAIKTME